MYVGHTRHIQAELLGKYLEGDIKSVLLVRGICYQCWLPCSLHEL